MNKLNRLIVVIFLFVAILTCTASLVVPDIVLQFAQRLIDATQSFDWLARVVVAVILNIFLFVLLISELRRTTDRAVVKVRGTVAEISPESIEAQIHQHVGEMPDLLDVSVHVRPIASGRVKIALDVLAAPHVMVAEKVRDINGIVRGVAKNNLGLTIAGAPTIRVELASPAAVAHTEERLGARLLQPPKPAPEAFSFDEEAAEDEAGPPPDTIILTPPRQREVVPAVGGEAIESEPPPPPSPPAAAEPEAATEEEMTEEPEPAFEPEPVLFAEPAWKEPPAEARPQAEVEAFEPAHESITEELPPYEEVLPSTSDLEGTPFAAAAAAMDAAMEAEEIKAEPPGEVEAEPDEGTADDWSADTATEVSEATPEPDLAVAPAFDEAPAEVEEIEVIEVVEEAAPEAGAVPDEIPAGWADNVDIAESAQSEAGGEQEDGGDEDGKDDEDNEDDANNSGGKKRRWGLFG